MNNTDKTNETASAQPENSAFNFTAKEKLAASIVDQLCPVIIHETGQHIGPKLFRKLTIRLAELL